MNNLIISPETANKLNKTIGGCKHPRKYLRSVSNEGAKVSQLYCIGCGTWFDVLDVLEVVEKKD